MIFQISLVILALILLLVLIVHLTNSLVGLIAIIKGAPYVPSRKDIIDDILAEIHLPKGARCIDIGSGDGRITIELAKAGYEAYGIEISPYLALKSRFNIKRKHVKNAHIYWGDLWGHDLSSYDCIVMYGVGRIMQPLEKKIVKECKPGTLVISNFFKMPSLKLVTTRSRVKVYTV